ncbi:LA_3696 family protein [Leptospira yasudae]|uniref:DUF1640 domain-containing protein n=1 Tax=Leptospira yasudae TaxID=2202201 RepID=A0A6N4QUN8_9LEPT|nr:hypothetical protein [Leptospira yasudae]TGL74442.1 hypothetical protein EHQ72_17830 [Leptospira yasudae]TGL80724.1 hypothetical protein EHQ77_07575 [Leptospira yasudae]TGL84346.1 hypothetical protein EHQ83_11575 [Leptospira yasudae]
MTALVQKVPRRLGELLGPEGTIEFVDYLNRAFGNIHSNAIETVSDRFELRLSDENSKLRAEISGLKTELRSEFQSEFSRLRSEFAEHRADIKSEIAEIHKAISVQTKWILGAVIGLVGVFSILIKF